MPSKMTSSTRSDFAGSIRAEGLGKTYRMPTAAGAARLKFNEIVTREIQRLLSPAQWRRRPESFWALRDVDFEIHPGELIGLVGRNGSGKSTLLKLLARVTKPTAGRAWLRGRVGSLLEVGTGFHPELTGYENIYLCGTILGMSRAEIAASFDEIVAFSEVESFLHIPIKRLSSGMAMRLAFSVAAHLHPDVLLVDEALSVGDASFQKKCLAKMHSFVASGATVIFVTHDIGLVNKWCKRVLLLEQGRLIEDGPAASVTPKYLRNITAVTAHRVSFTDHPSGSTGLTIRELTINEGGTIDFGRPFGLEIVFEAFRRYEQISFGVGISNLEGTRLVSFDSDLPGERLLLPTPGIYSAVITAPRLDLSPGSYLVDVSVRLGDSVVLDHRPACLRMEVTVPDSGPSSAYIEATGLRPAFAWKLQARQQKVA